MPERVRLLNRSPPALAGSVGDGLPEAGALPDAVAVASGVPVPGVPAVLVAVAGCGVKVGMDV